MVCYVVIGFVVFYGLGVMGSLWLVMFSFDVYSVLLVVGVLVVYVSLVVGFVLIVMCFVFV